MTMKELQKLQKSKEEAAQRIIKKMETKITPDFQISNVITCYVDHGYGSYYFAAWKVQSKYGVFPKSMNPLELDIIDEIHPEKLKRFVMYCLEENKEENIKLIHWIEKGEEK